MGLLAQQRREYILNELRNNGRIRVNQAAQTFHVTEVTIRRDLDYLEQNGLLKKTYGGAVLTDLPDMNMSVRFRHTRNVAAKKTIGQLASALIHDGDIIYLEAGSTCFEIVPYLIEKKSLTIIVNSLHLMSRLHEQIRHKIIVTGGLYRPERMDMIGPSAEATISQLGGFKAFTGADDISITGGISGADVATVTFTRLVLRQAAQVVFVGDHTKFDNPALYKIADIDELDFIVTDIEPLPDWQKAAQEREIQLIYPGSKEG
ncbi:MAG: DeoR/GlpR transcriptional regulator [Sedimentisphaerales bacterium]|nr:DeoR/GlpR transcriptional regulator [Sedimentisphaerales bacterium]